MHTHLNNHYACFNAAFLFFARTIPYYTDQIVPEAVDKGKRVLIASSENAIRGLLMHLMDIPEEKIAKLEIPNGLPLIYDVKSRCIKLLDDGSTEDPLSKHNFGESADYLFRPCLIDYDDEDVSVIGIHNCSRRLILYKYFNFFHSAHITFTVRNA